MSYKTVSLSSLKISESIQRIWNQIVKFYENEYDYTPYDIEYLSAWNYLIIRRIPEGQERFTDSELVNKVGLSEVDVDLLFLFFRDPENYVVKEETLGIYEKHFNSSILTPSKLSYFMRLNLNLIPFEPTNFNDIKFYYIGQGYSPLRVMPDFDTLSHYLTAENPIELAILEDYDGKMLASTCIYHTEEGGFYGKIYPADEGVSEWSQWMKVQLSAKGFYPIVKPISELEAHICVRPSYTVIPQASGINLYVPHIPLLETGTYILQENDEIGSEYREIGYPFLIPYRYEEPYLTLCSSLEANVIQDNSSMIWPLFSEDRERLISDGNICIYSINNELNKALKKIHKKVAPNEIIPRDIVDINILRFTEFPSIDALMRFIESSDIKTLKNVLGWSPPKVPEIPTKSWDMLER